MVSFDIDNERIRRVMDHVEAINVINFLEKGKVAPEDDFDEFAEWKLKQMIKVAGKVSSMSKSEHNCNAIGHLNRELVKKARYERLLVSLVGC